MTPINQPDITIRIHRRTYKKLKVSAAKSGMTLKDYVEQITSIS